MVRDRGDLIIHPKIKCLTVSDRLYFAESHKLHAHDGNKEEVLRETPFVINCIHAVGNIIYIGADHGIMVIGANEGKYIDGSIPCGSVTSITSAPISFVEKMLKENEFVEK